MVLMPFSILGQCSTCITPENIAKDLWNISHIQDSGNAQPDKKIFFPYIINFDKTTRGWSGLLQNYLCARYQVMK